MNEISKLILLLGHKKAIKLVIEKGLDVNAAEKDWKMTPLHYIALSDRYPGPENWTEDDYLGNLSTLCVRIFSKQTFIASTVKKSSRQKTQQNVGFVTDTV